MTIKCAVDIVVPISVDIAVPTMVDLVTGSGNYRETLMTWK